MIKPLLFALLFTIVGLVAFALLSPLIFHGADFRKLGATAFPIIGAICGCLGFAFGSRQKKS